MNERACARAVTLRDFWAIFARRWWIMLLAAVACAGGVCLFHRLTFVPQYESTATLYILRQNGDAASNDASTDFSLALKAVSDCTYLLKSHAVVDEVIDDLSLELSYSELYDCISVSNPEDTRILEVMVRSDTPEKAKKIVDRLCEIGQVKIAEAMGFPQVNLYEYGTLAEAPVLTMGPAAYFLVGLTAAVLVYSTFLLAFLLDDRIHTEEDIERCLGLSVLGNIPDTGGRKKRRDAPYLVRLSGEGKESLNGTGSVNTP